MSPLKTDWMAFKRWALKKDKKYMIYDQKKRSFSAAKGNVAIYGVAWRQVKLVFNFKDDEEKNALRKTKVRIEIAYPKGGLK